MSRARSAAAVRPASIVAAAVLAVAFGVVAFLEMPIAPAPRSEGPRLVVTAGAAGATADELVELVTVPLERQLLALPSVAGVDSASGDGELRLVVRGRVGADADALRLAVERRLSRIEMPVERAEVELEPADVDPLLEVAVLGGDPAARAAFARDVLAPELARAAPSEGIELLGAAPLRVVVAPRRAALAARGLTAADLASRLRRIGATTSLGRVREGAVARPLVVGETVTSLAQLGELRLPAAGGVAVLRDVATISLRPLGDGSVVRIDGAPAVLARVFAERHRNALVDGARLRRASAALARRAPRGLVVRVVADAGAGVVAAGAWLASDRLAASASKTLTLGLTLEPQLAPEERAARGERLARELIRTLPVAPREWSWVQRAAAERAPGGEVPVGWLRLSFPSFDALRTARTAARRWLATTTAARGWIEAGAVRSLARDDRAAIEVWCSAGTEKERRALAARAKARLASALPERLIVDGAPPQVEWRIARRASRIGAGGVDMDEAIDAALGGFDVGSLQVAGVEAGIRLLAAPGDDLALVPVRAAAGLAGPVVPLGTQATLNRVSRTAPIERHDGSPAVRLIVRGGAKSDVSTVRRALAAVAVGPGARLDVTGSAAGE